VEDCYFIDSKTVFASLPTRDFVITNIWLQYEVGGEPIERTIELQTTRPHWGGQRCWFICLFSGNGRACRRRVTKLYLPPGSKYYACRRCHALTYRSQRELRPMRLLSKAQKIRRRLGGSGSIYDRFPGRPGRMRWQTYDALREKAEQAKRKYFSLAPV
jgi:hypothetical protein